MLPEEFLPVLDNGLPAALSTCSADGEPNLALLSAVYYVDPTHVALSFQFFSKTFKNIRENSRASLVLIDFDTMTNWVLAIEFSHEETEGKIFDEMDMRIQAIASTMGLQDVFKLRGAHIYEVLSIEKVDFMPSAQPA